MRDIFALRDRIRACTACSLRDQAKAPVPWSGPTPAHYAVVGMAPGYWEDQQGRPWVGRAGIHLRAMLKAAKFPMHDIAWLNSVCCFPGRCNGGDIKPSRIHLDACHTNLTDQLAIINPRYILLFGTTALEAFRPDLDLQNIHGMPMFYPGQPHPTYLWPTYHPVAALRSVKYEQLLTDDLANFWVWRRSGELWPETCFKCNKELYSYDEWGVATCQLHTAKQLSLL